MTTATITPARIVATLDDTAPIVAQLRRDHPSANGRVDRGLRALLEGRVAELDAASQTAIVVGSAGDRYAVSLLNCECADATARGGVCYHGAALRIALWLAALAAERARPTRRLLSAPRVCGRCGTLFAPLASRSYCEFCLAEAQTADALARDAAPRRRPTYDELFPEED